MCRIGFCPGCSQHGVILTKHHKWKRSVWGRNKKKNGKAIWLCRQCHDIVEAEITRKENELLQQHPEIYIGTLNEFLSRAGIQDFEQRKYTEIAVERPKPEKVKYRIKPEDKKASFPQGLLMLVD